MMSCKKILFLVCIGVLLVNGQDENNVVDEDLTITKSQKDALDKFKARVLPVLPQGYMKEDIYLIRWLRAKNFDVNQAEEFLKENLKWRKSLNIDNIHSEDFSDMEAAYPVFVDTYAKNGAPVITAVAGAWDLRAAQVTGQSNRLHRFLFKIMDEATQKTREEGLKGKQVTRFHFLLNLDGFNIVQHGCPRCILGIIQFLQAYESHFPGMTDKIVILNAPTTIQALRPIVRGAISGRTRGHIRLFGTNKQEWLPYLLKFIDINELPEDFGGTRVRQ